MGCLHCSKECGCQGTQPSIIRHAVFVLGLLPFDGNTLQASRPPGALFLLWEYCRRKRARCLNAQQQNALRSRLRTCLSLIARHRSVILLWHIVQQQYVQNSEQATPKGAREAKSPQSFEASSAPHLSFFCPCRLGLGLGLSVCVCVFHLPPF